MNYTEMCRYIAAREGFPDWEEFIKVNRSRKEPVRFTRQLCMYIGSVCYPKISYKSLGRVFGKDHATAMHAIKTISFERDLNRTLAHKIGVYIDEITKLIYGDIKEVPAEVSLMFDDVMTAIEKMRIIAEAYCEITGKRLV